MHRSMSQFMITSNEAIKLIITYVFYISAQVIMQCGFAHKK